MEETTKNLLIEMVSSFETDEIREFAKFCIKNAPKYWFHVPASSTGKYHPKFSLGDGGLLRHEAAVLRLLNHMFMVESIASDFTSRERDLLRVAAIIHDMWKSGTQEDYEKSKWTKFDHPLIAADHVRNMVGLPSEDLEFIAHAVESHMGQWNTDKRHPDIELPKPSDKYQKILHLADYLASRKDINMDFDGIEIPESEPEPLPDINTWIVKFGKYKDEGLTIPQLAEKYPGYFRWAQKNVTIEPAKTMLQSYEV